MSLERACVNCERCYHLASFSISDSVNSLVDPETGEITKQIEDSFGTSDLMEVRKNPNFRKINVYTNDQVYIARNEAMKALEAVFSLIAQDSYFQLGTHEDAVHALKACRSCDYSAPKIVETIEREKSE